MNNEIFIEEPNRIRSKKNGMWSSLFIAPNELQLAVSTELETKI